MSEENRALSRRFIEGYVQGDADVVDELLIPSPLEWDRVRAVGTHKPPAHVIPAKAGIHHGSRWPAGDGGFRRAVGILPDLVSLCQEFST